MDDFLFEIIVVSGLSHPNIVSFLGASIGLLDFEINKLFSYQL
jgi:hypothetical protein